MGGDGRRASKRGSELLSVVFLTVRSMGRRNTYDNFDMWSDDNEEEIRLGWIYTGARG